MKNKIEIIICGDLCPTEDTVVLFEQEDEISLFNTILNTFNSVDLVFGNLEFVLTDTPKPIKKSGPILHGASKYSTVFKKAGFNLLSLANNHIKDCGPEGVQSTMEACAKAGIATFGAALNLGNAKKPYIEEINGLKIGFIAFAEQEFNTATENEAGANYFDPYEDLDSIAEFKKQVDYLIVIYHGGIEYYEYPSPLLQKKCRKFIDKGADFVSCQHSHCIGTMEEYANKKILYGQGNTLFGYRKGNNSWNHGLLVKIVIDTENRIADVLLMPIHATVKGIEFMDAAQSTKLLSNLYLRSKNLNNEKFIKEAWANFCNKKKEFYFPFLFGFNRYLIHLNRFTKNSIVRLFYSKKRMHTSHNIIRCEAHNEVIQTLLNNHLKN
jgi:poly-gamma-glutamate capsule biosynthesis protein CapA/YwtB (metallophosphatase superfamily)